MAFAASGSGSTLKKAAHDKDGGESARRSRILSSKLYFDVHTSKVPLIYSSSYDIAFLGIEKLHPFDSSKWGRICRFLIAEGFLDKNHVIEPLEAKREDLLVLKSGFRGMKRSGVVCVSAVWRRRGGARRRDEIGSSDGAEDWRQCTVPLLFCSLSLCLTEKQVHSESYLDSLKSSLTVSTIVEVPPVAFLPNWLVDRFVGGTILAAKLAKERGWAINIGGGFHHCSAENGGGFCAYADISLCIYFAFIRFNISRVMIIDLDAHQGNGYEKDFCDDRRVYILDVYNPDIYPFDYEARRCINQKVEIVSGTTTNEYLSKLDGALEVAADAFDPELIIYNAGTDILDGDPLGRLKISPDGIATRDEKVFMFARERAIPLVMLTSGGYMKSSAKVIADSIINLSKKSLITLESIQK
ncbi:histone deacetylase [Orobanche hederae]